MVDGPTLSRAMSHVLPITRYDVLARHCNVALRQANCTTVNRAAMFLAQIGHESVGLKYTEEIASGEAYNGRQDLGNTQPGDGPRFKGRSYIQVTGRHNYGALSRWAHSKGYVPTPTYFVDNPTRLAGDQYAFLGAVWYWIAARNMNSYADAKDIVGATRAVNGGLNGLEDRRLRWNRCLALGTQILPSAGSGGIEETMNEAELKTLVHGEIVEAMRALTHGSSGGDFTDSKNPLWVRKPGNGVLDRLDNQAKRLDAQAARNDRQGKRLDRHLERLDNLSARINQVAKQVGGKVGGLKALVEKGDE